MNEPMGPRNKDEEVWVVFEKAYVFILVLFSIVILVSILSRNNSQPPSELKVASDKTTSDLNIDRRPNSLLKMAISAPKFQHLVSGCMTQQKFTSLKKEEK